MATFEDNPKLLEQQKTGENTIWFTVLAPELQSTATRTSKLQWNRSASGILLTIKAANTAGTPTFTPKLVGVDDAGNAVVLTTQTAVAGDGTTLYWIHPVADKSATAKSSATEYGSCAVPRSWELVLTYAGVPANDKMDTEAHACYVL